MWQSNFKGLIDSKTLISFHNYQQLKSWYYENSNKNTLFFINDTLQQNSQTGLTLIEHLDLKQQCYLVTHHYKDHEAHQRCLALGIKIIPKSYIPYIKIKSSQQEEKNYILIDDSEIVQTIWQLAAEKAKVELTVYSSEKEFFNIHQSHPKNTLIYIDSNLANDIKGELVAEEIYRLGFQQISLTTGYDPAKFTGKYPWIKEVISKKPPF